MGGGKVGVAGAKGRWPDRRLGGADRGVSRVWIGRTEFNTWFMFMFVVIHFFLERRCLLGVLELHEQEQLEILVIEKLEILEILSDRVPEVRVKTTRQFRFSHGTFSPSSCRTRLRLEESARPFRLGRAPQLIHQEGLCGRPS